MAAEELAAWSAIEAKTGEIEPGNIIEILLLTRDELDVLMKHPKLSKNQKKKVARRQKWLDEAPSRREKRLEKKKQGKMKRLYNHKANITTTENFDKKFHIAIDFATGADMRDVEKLDLAKQARWCYQKYRRTENEVQLHFLGLHDEQNKDMSIFFDRHSKGWQGWDLHRDKHVTDYVSNAVYLTAEAEETIDKLEPGVMYIIGGVVDRNRLPGLCADHAKSLNIPQKKLPLKEHISMETRTVLTINHVFEILLAVRNELSWKDAIISVIPDRKRIIYK